MVALSIYDPLTWPNDKGQYVPYLAESVTPNADYTEWRIKVRPGITFTDGTPLDADTVKLNLDSYRGKNPNIDSTLFALVQLTLVRILLELALKFLITARARKPMPREPKGGGNYILDEDSLQLFL